MQRVRPAHPNAPSGLIEAKLREGTAAVPLLRRHALVERLRADQTSRLILLRAPAGYGKTILLAQRRAQLAEAQLPHGWLTVDRGDREPDVLLAYLVEGLERAGLRFERGVATRVARMVRVDLLAAARLLVAGARLTAERAYLMIDGLDRLAAGSGMEFIEGLLRYVDGLQILATARRRPALELASLRAAGLLQELGPRELRFSASEIESLFEDSLPPDYVDTLLLRTDGVAVALRFARAALQSRHPAVPWTAWLDEYYEEQVLEALPSELRTLISRLVIVERFDTSLARAIMGRDVGAELERLLVEEGVLSTEPHSGLFYFPALLRETLLKRLQWFDEDERQEMHRRASAWFASRGLPAQALSHALAAHDGAQALSLFSHVGAVTLLARLGYPAFKAALEQLQGAVNADRALLGWSRALLLSQEGRTAEAAAAAEQLSASPGEPPRAEPTALASPADSVTALVDRESLIIDTLVSAYADRRLPSGREQALGQAARQLAGVEHLSQGVISTLLCWMRCERADFDAAERDSERAIAEFTEDDGVYASLFMHLHRTIIRFWQNRLEEALVESDLAGKLRQLFFPTDPRFEWLWRVFQAWLLFEVGRLEEAQALLEGVFEQAGAADGWFEAQLQAHVTAARVAAARGDLGAAMNVIDHGLRLAEQRDLPRLAWQMEFQRADLSLAAGAAADIPQALRFHHDPARDPCFFTWRERFQAAVLTARWAIRDSHCSLARDVVDTVERELGSRDIPRARTVLTLLRARIALIEGDRTAHEDLLRSAVRSSGRLPSPQLFRNEGLEPPVAEVSTDPLQAGPSTAATVPEPPPGLTPREREIFELIAAGHSNKIVARQTGVSVGTVKFHLSNIYRKLDAHNRVQAVSRRAGPLR